MTKSTTSRKIRTKKQAAAAGEAEQSESIIVPPLTAGDSPLPDDWAVEVVRRVLDWQIKRIQMKPSQDIKEANSRARDSRTLTELVRTLEKLDAVVKRHEGKGKKPKSRDDKEIKEQFVRRLDQLLAARDEGGVPAKPQRG